MKERNRRKSQKKKTGSFTKILILVCSAMVYSAVLSNLIDRSATDLVVNAYHDESLEQLQLVNVTADPENSRMLLDQKYPLRYLNTESDLLETDEMLAATVETVGKRSSVYVLETDGELSKVMLDDSTVGYVRTSAISNGLNVIFDDCDEVKYISEDTVLLSEPDGDAEEVAELVMNDEVTLSGTNDETYWRVEYDGTTAYVDHDYLMDEMIVIPEPEPEPVAAPAVAASYSEPESDPEWDGSVLTRSAGVVYGPSGKETYYNLNMSGVISILQGMGINEEYWVRGDGVKMYGDYILAACAFDIRPRGSTVETSLGTAICADTGGFAASNPTQVDIAVDW
ncbi:MAG: SH3 domain-containing protein [Erysipelotrichaceae bacterium]|nr:SH3 domain-containing protein [Erysipelotrichaceae bacterium]